MKTSRESATNTEAALTNPIDKVLNMAERIVPTSEQLRELLRYEPETGKLYWKERGLEWFVDSPLRSAQWSRSQWNGRFSGKEAFTAHLNGYKQGRILGEYASAHRVAWAMHYGSCPDGEVDHINMVRDDNRIVNLRLATPSNNRMNRGSQKNNTSGYKGVFWQKLRGKWMAQIQIDGRAIFLGRYDSKEDAHAAYCEAANKYHGEFARTE